MHPGQKLKPGARVVFEGVHTLHGEVLERRFFGRRLIRLWTEDGTPVDAAVDAIGHVPLPPYIKRDDRADGPRRYQTVFARARGSVAAPTAGLHFTPALARRAAARGVEIGRDHAARRLRHLSAGARRARRGASARAGALRDRRRGRRGDQPRAATSGRRVIAVGTTTTRTLEAVARAHGGRDRRRRAARPICSSIPGFTFRVVSGLLTNFHLPRSSLLMLVSRVCRPRARPGRVSMRRSPSATGSTATAMRC